MASYRYFMVYLPEVSRSTFLLYTHRGTGWMALRDYSQGREIELAAPLPANVLQDTKIMLTRFPVQPHTVKDLGHWTRITSEYNEAKSVSYTHLTLPTK